MRYSKEIDGIVWRGMNRELQVKYIEDLIIQAQKDIIPRKLEPIDVGALTGAGVPLNQAMDKEQFAYMKGYNDCIAYMHRGILAEEQHND